jgi:hypothetical protein
MLYLKLIPAILVLSGVGFAVFGAAFWAVLASFVAFWIVFLARPMRKVRVWKL